MGIHFEVGRGRLFNYDGNFNSGKFEYISLYSLYVRFISSIVDCIANDSYSII